MLDEICENKSNLSVQFATRIDSIGFANSIMHLNFWLRGHSMEFMSMRIHSWNEFWK